LPDWGYEAGRRLEKDVSGVKQYFFYRDVDKEHKRKVHGISFKGLCDYVRRALTWSRSGGLSGFENNPSICGSHVKVLFNDNKVG
jgi:hypothetical protein